MSPTVRAAPAFVTLALRPLPLAPLQPLLSALLDAVVRQHPRIFDRLGEHARKRFGIDPTDMPFAIELDPRPEAPRIAAVRRLPESGLDARIAGPLAGLLGLADGALDGDALFFSRDLVVEGDIAAIVALRNAIDDAGVDLVAAAASSLGPFGAPFELMARLVGSALAPLTRARQWS
jgi:predicted lipid carrier protein YhbT